jgi:galactokinase/mevalonate kinase-like predicted kinase
VARAAHRIRVTAPARANLLGNPSDLYGGAVLACSVPLRARVWFDTGEGCRLEAEGRGVALRGPSDLALRGDRFDLARAVLAELGPPSGCTIRWETEIPLQSGLAGSTALLVALVRGLLAWRGESLAPDALAERARWIERTRLGITCGFVDHYLCSFGGLRFVDLRGKERDLPPGESPLASCEPVAAPPGPLPFLLAQTGVRHHSGQVHAPIRTRWERGEPEVVAAYVRLRELAFEGRAAFERAEWGRLGALMDENHAVQQRLGGSGQANDRLIEAARRAGAPGAKLAGAGHGGTIVALWPDPDARALETALRRAGAVGFHRPEAVPGVQLEPVA